MTLKKMVCFKRQPARFCRGNRWDYKTITTSEERGSESYVEGHSLCTHVLYPISEEDKEIRLCVAQLELHCVVSSIV